MGQEGMETSTCGNRTEREGRLGVGVTDGPSLGETDEAAGKEAGRAGGRALSTGGRSDKAATADRIGSGGSRTETAIAGTLMCVPVREPREDEADN